MADLARLVVRLEAESSRLQSELNKADARIKKFEKDTDSVSSKIKGSFKNAFAGISAAIGGAALVNLTKNSIQARDNIQKLGVRLGISTEALSQYQFVAEQTNVSQRTLELGFQRMTRRISEAAQGAGEAKNAIAELGIDVEKLNQLTPDAQFEALADAMQRVEAPADRVRLAMKLFDSEGVALLQTMEGGSKAIRAMREEADRMGLTLGQDAADAAARANSALSKLGALGQALGMTLVTALSPAIEDVANWFQTRLPIAIQVTANAFRDAQSFVLETVSSISSSLGAASRFLTISLPGTGPATDDVSNAMRSFADEMERVSNTADRASVRIQSLKSTNDTYASSLQTGISFNQLYNQALAESFQGESRSAGVKREAKQAQDELNDSLQRANTILAANLTPLEEYQQKIQELNILRGEQPGVITDDIYARAVERYGEALDNASGKTEQFRQLQSVIGEVDPVSPLLKQLETLEELEQAFPQYANIVGEAMLNVQEKIDGINEGMVESTEKVKSEWEKLGPVFSSAFEDAIVEGKSFRDVLEGIYKDIVRIATRQLVTEPLGNAVAGFFGGGGGGSKFDLSELFGGLTGAFTGADFVVGPQTSPNIGGLDNRVLAMRVADGERITVTPKNQSSGQTINLGPIVVNAKDVDSFSSRESQTQLGASIRRSADIGLRNL